MPSIKDIVERSDITAGRRFDFCIQALILVSLAGLTLETVQGLPSLVYKILEWVEFVTIGIFTMEYVLRLYVADSKIGFIRSGWAIVDIVAIVPSYIGLDWRWLRALRMLRLFKLLRNSSAVDHIFRAFTLAKEELKVFGLMTLIMLYISAAGIYFAEHNAQPEVFSSIPASLWWAVVTLTTVGYGDAYPVTGLGRFFTGLVMLTGLGVVAGFTGVITTALSRAREEARSGVTETDED